MRPVNSVRRTLHQRAETRFRFPQRLLAHSILNRPRYLLRHHRQQRQVMTVNRRLFVISLHHQRPEAVPLRFQRHAHPIQRPRFARFHGALLHQLPRHFRSRQQRLARAQHMVHQVALQLARLRCFHNFIAEIRDAQQLPPCVIDRHLKIARIHQLIENLMDPGEKLLQVARAAGLLRQVGQHLRQSARFQRKVPSLRLAMRLPRSGRILDVLVHARFLLLSRRRCAIAHRADSSLVHTEAQS